MMTNPGVRPRARVKHQQLLRAAMELIHRQGFVQTTLAQIADRSGVPLGNVYYYFRSKDAIVEAVIDERQRSLAQAHSLWSLLPEPQERIRASLQMLIENRESLTSWGCPVGGLTLELNKFQGKPELVAKAETLFRLHIDWLSEQFAAMGRDDAKEAAIQLVATIQGAILLANGMKDRRLFERQMRRLMESV